MKFIPHLIYVPDLHQISRKTTIIKVLSIKSSKIIRLLRKEKGEKELHRLFPYPKPSCVPGDNTDAYCLHPPLPSRDIKICR